MSLLFVPETWAVVLTICSIGIGIAVWFAPEGYEDETGLHLSETNSPQEVKLVRPHYGPMDKSFFSTAEFDSMNRSKKRIGGFTLVELVDGWLSWLRLV